MRKCEPLPADLSTLARLQWGRNFIVAEIYTKGFDKYLRQALQWGRNFIVAEMSSSLRMQPAAPPRFNGAATLSLRKSGWWGNWLSLLKASMGPQLYRCGNNPADANDVITHLLQWGRNFIVAEIRTNRHKPGSSHGASMGPQLYRCGNLAFRS